MRAFVFCFLMLVEVSCLFSQPIFNASSDNSRELILSLEKTLKILTDSLGEEHLDIAIYCDSLGNLLMRRNYSHADSLFNKGLKIRLRQLDENHISIAESYQNLAKLNKRIANYYKAKEHYQKASKIFLYNLDEDNLKLAGSYLDLGGIYWQLNNYEKAVEYYEKLLNIDSKILIKSPWNLSSLYDSAASLCSKIQNYDKAKQYYQKYLNSKRKNLNKSDSLSIARIYRKLGKVYMNLHNYKEAELLYKKSSDILQSYYPENNVRIACNYSHLAELYHKLGKTKQAGYYDKKAKNIHENDKYWNRAKAELEQLSAHYFELSDEERMNRLNIINKKFNHYYSYTQVYRNIHTIQNAVNLLLNTKGVALDYNISMRGFMQKINHKNLVNIERELRTIDRQIAKAKVKSVTERINEFIELDTMYEYRNNLINQILDNKNLKERMESNSVFFNWKDVQAKLKKYQISIDIVRFAWQGESRPPNYYAALISKNHPQPQFIPMGKEKVISYLLQTDDNGRPKYLEEMLYRKELYRIIWQPLLPYLEGITTIHISPVGLLHRVSFETLQNDKEHYLGEQFQFHYYSSMRDFIKKKPTNQPYKDAVLMGDILYDLEDTLQYRTEEWYAMRNGERGKVKRLEATLDEVIDIHKACDNTGVESKVLTYNNATEDTIQYFSGERAPSILHFATHGLYLEPIDVPKTGGTVEERLRSLTNPLQRSVLMLYGANHRWEKNESAIGTDEDGILTALEVTALDLRKTNLVVLSACSTALGEVQHNTEGVFGLQRAFKLAGVDYVVASLWDVEDDATKDLMVEFYKNLLELKQDPATALRNAKHKFMRDGDDPELWAGFILIE